MADIDINEINRFKNFYKKALGDSRPIIATTEDCKDYVAFTLSKPYYRDASIEHLERIFGAEGKVESTPALELKVPISGIDYNKLIQALEDITGQEPKDSRDEMKSCHRSSFIPGWTPSIKKAEAELSGRNNKS